MDPGFLKLLDDDEDDNAQPPAADVDAFAAVLKGDLGGAAHAAAAAAGGGGYGVARTGNGMVQPVPQSPAAPVTTGPGGIKPVSLAPSPGQQQLLWSQLTPDQQRDIYQRRLQHRLQLQQQQQQQIPQQPHQQSQQPPRAEPASGAPGARKGQTREGISFTALMPLLQPHLPPEQGQQLSVLYQRFKRNEISREDFIRGARVIAGDHVLVKTIREMHGKQQQAQLALQQQELQKQREREQQQHQQSQPQSSESHSTKPPQLLSPNVSGSGAAMTAQHQPQQHQLKEQTCAQQSLQLQTTQTPTQTLEPNVTSATQQKVGHPQAHPFQQTQVPSTADLKPMPQGSQPPSNLSSSLAQAQLKSSAIKQGDRHQDAGQVQPLNNKPTVPMLLQQVKHQVDISLGKQQAPSSMLAQPRLPPMLQPTVVTGAGQQPQLYSQMGLPQQSLPGQTPGHVHLHQAQAVPQVPGPVTPLPLPAAVPIPVPAAIPIPAAVPVPAPAPAPAPAPQAQPPPEKPLTKYAKQKLRREQKKREEEERARKLAEEERRKKMMEEENMKELQSTPSGTVMVAHHGLHPQLSTPTGDLNKQAYAHHPGSLSHQAQMQAQVDRQQGAQIAPSGLVAAVQGLPLIPVKEEPSDLQSEQTRQSFQLPKTLDLLSGQAAQKPVGQAQLSETSVLPTSQGQVPERSSSEQVPGSMLLPAPSTATNLAQQADVASATSLVPVSSFAGGSGLQSTVPMKQHGVGQQGLGSVPAAGLNSTSMHPPASIGQTSQAAAPVSATPAAKTGSKKPAAGQKKAAESAPGQQPASKKQKVSGAEPDQSIDQLNDVTAVSGVNLKEEEEQLLVGPKEESRTTEAMRKIVQEEEERLFLERGPLRAKVAAIAKRCGVKSVSEDVGRCLSMSVEERLRSMLYRLIKLSKQRCDVDKERHKVIVTSDVRRQILLMKRRAKEMLDKKMAEESERLRKLNEKKDKGSLPEVEREELKAKAQKAQQEEEDRLKANAANVAARAAVGADDMLLKWQMMAAQGRQKRQGGDAGAAEDGAANKGGSSAEGVSASHADKKLENGDSATAGPGNAEIDSQGPSASATGRPPGPGPGVTPRLLSGRRMVLSKFGRGERAITIKDVIAFLETEPQMSKSTLLYRLYERERRNADGEKGHAANWR
ncbi:unnamed protein product [Calypogeia fissa]